MTEEDFIKDFIEISAMTEDQTEGLYDPKESNHSEWLEQYEESFVAEYAIKAGISWEKANKILLDNID